MADNLSHLHKSGPNPEQATGRETADSEKWSRAANQVPAASITFDDAADSAPCSTGSLAGRVAAG